MISEKLRQEFHILETVFFLEYQKANKKERERICKKLGEYEGRKIIEEINQQSKLLKN